MTILHRLALPFTNAFIITCALFYLMFQLVNTQDPELAERFFVPPVKWTFVDQEPPVKTIVAKPAPPEEPELQPIVADIKEPITDIKISQNFGEPYRYEKPKGKLSDIASNQLALVFAYPPVYPRGANTRGIEGYVVVGFSVDTAGTVYDAFVIESEPNKIFDKSALNAIKRFKYKARVEQGKTVTTSDQRYLFRYELDD